MSTRPPFPVEETERLARLRLLNVLDSSPEPIFDALTRTASLICEVPIALVSLVDSDRQWFKSKVGLDGVSETPRELAFCAHAILESKVMEVPDATQDSRFQDNPLVTGRPDIRFYAGAPLIMSGGEAVGTLCVIDTKPRDLTDFQRSALSSLAEAASRALELRQQALELDSLNNSLLKKAEEAHSREAPYHAIVEDQTDLISLALPTGELTFVNQAYADHFGLTPAEMRGRNLLEFVSPEAREAVSTHLQMLCRAPGVATGENQMRSTLGLERWVAWSNRSIGDETGRVITLHSVGRDITDRKRSELALQASQARFRALYESTPAMLHSIDPSGRVLYVSDKWLSTLGYTREEVVGKLSTDFFTPASKEYAQSFAIPRFFETGRCDDIAYQMVCKDGRVLDVQLSAVLERDSQGVPLHSLAVIQDVTEKNAITTALRVNEERLDLATKVNEIGIWEFDLHSGRLDWTDTMFTILGGSRSEFKGSLDDWSSKVHPEDLSFSQRQFEKAMSTHQPMDFDFRVLGGNGEIRYINARSVVIEDSQGTASRILGTNYDITQRKRVEHALLHSEQRLRTIANNLPILIAHIDSEYRYTFANDNYQTWFSLDEPVEGRTIREVFGEEIFARVQPRMKEALTGQHVSFEVVNTIPNSPPNLLVHYLPDRDESGAIHGIYGMVLDRTEQHRAQELVENSERRLRAVTDNLPVLISYVDTHEKVTFLNRTFHDWIGVDLSRAIGRELRDVIGMTLYEQRREPLRRALQGERMEFELESTMNGIKRYVQATYIPDIRADGTVHGVFALSTDVTELKAAELELRQLVRIDSLTGLPNRRHFHDKLNKAIARSRRTGSTMALMFLDIDHFKSVNDSLGHGAGDRVLCEFADRIRSVVRISDTAVRLAGDEFVLILEDLAQDIEAEKVAKKVLEAIRKPMHVANIEIVVTTSIGIAINHAEETTSVALIDVADQALYRAKAAGKNAYSM